VSGQRVEEDHDAHGPRRFACSAVAVQAIILTTEEGILLLPLLLRNQLGAWQPISGGLEAAETVLEGVLWAVREEADPQMQVRPWGVVHAHTFYRDTGNNLWH
jgi:hypothetical protein